MRAVILLVACSSDPATPTIDLATAHDLTSPADLGFRDLEISDLSQPEPAVDLSMAEPDLSPLPDLRNPDLTPCGGPNQACCGGITCSQSAAMAFGWVGSMCVTGTCEACGNTTERCCPGDFCISVPQNYNYCHINPDGTHMCVECVGGVPC